MTAGIRATAIVVALSAAWLVGCADDDTSSPPATSPPPPPTNRTSVYDLATGDCLDGLDRNQDLRVRPVACDRRHQAEVYGTVELPGRRFPGVDVLRRRAATTCATRFAAYAGEPAGPGLDLAFTEVVPSLASWSAGDRLGLCVAVGVDGAPLTASLAAGGDA